MEELQQTTIQKALLNLMKKTGIKEFDIANGSGLKQPAVSVLLRGQIENPRIDTAFKLAKFFDVPMEYLATADETLLDNKEKEFNNTISLPEEIRQIPLIDLSQVKFWLMNGYVNIEKNIKKIPCYEVSEKAFALKALPYLKNICHSLDSKIVIEGSINELVDDSYMLISAGGNLPVLYHIIQEGNNWFLHAINREVSQEFNPDKHIIMGQLKFILTTF